jgi:hypothetical protein
MSAYSGTMEESQLLSSVYFDSWNLSHGENSSVWASSHPGGIRRKGPDATSYQERIRREEGARLVRLGPALPNHSGMHEAKKAKMTENSEFETSNLAWCWNMLGSVEYRCLVKFVDVW